MDASGALAALMRAARGKKLRTMCAARGLSIDDAIQDALLRSLESGRGVLHVDGETRARFAGRALKWSVIAQDRKIHGRKADAPRAFAALPETMPDPSPSPEDLAIVAELRSILAARGHLPVSQFLDGQSWSAQARALGVAVSTLTRRRDRWVQVRRVQRDLFIDLREDRATDIHDEPKTMREATDAH